jgi:hypothetical protein
MALELVEQAVRRSKEMLDNGEPSHKILDSLVFAAQHLAGNKAVSSILLLDKDGLLRNGASPGLPYDYLTAIDGLQPNSQIGTCAAAAATGNIVITPDFMADNKWAELRHLPLALGFVGAWSHPIKSRDGKVLGTFGTYFRESREPSKLEIDSIRKLSIAAATVLSSVT